MRARRDGMADRATRDPRGDKARRVVVWRPKQCEQGNVLSICKSANLYLPPPCQSRKKFGTAPSPARPRHTLCTRRALPSSLRPHPQRTTTNEHAHAQAVPTTINGRRTGLFVPGPDRDRHLPSFRRVPLSSSSSLPATVTAGFCFGQVLTRRLPVLVVLPSFVGPSRPLLGRNDTLRVGTSILAQDFFVLLPSFPSSATLLFPKLRLLSSIFPLPHLQLFAFISDPNIVLISQRAVRCSSSPSLDVTLTALPACSSRRSCTCSD